MNGNGKGEIIATSRNGEGEQREPVAIDQNMDVIVQRAEKQLVALEKVLKIAVSRTNPTDWVDQQGHPYLTASGAEKLMPLFGISLENAECKRFKYTDDEGEYYIYQYKGRFYWKAGTIEAIGACSSRDKFFAWNSAEKTYKPLSEVDETNIMKAAYSNMMMNGITRLLGIRNLTWEQLNKIGISQAKAHKVTYGGRGKATDEDIKKQQEISKWCMEIANGDKKEATKILEEATKFKGREGKEVPGVTSTKALRGKRLNIAHSKIKGKYENHKLAIDKPEVPEERIDEGQTEQGPDTGYQDKPV